MDKKRTLIIAGSNPANRDRVPWDADADIWVLNEAASIGWPQRVTAVFQLHPPEIYTAAANVNDDSHWRWLQQKHPFPVYMQDVDPRVPSSVRYPLDDAKKYLNKLTLNDYGHPDGDPVAYFTSSFPYALALALLHGYERIEIYGTELASGTEFQYQRDCFLLWIGVAVGHGVEVAMYSGHRIFDALLYGYQAREISIPVDYYRERLRLHEIELKTYTAREKHLRAAINKAISRKKHDVLAELMVEAEKHYLEHGQVAGAYGVAEAAIETHESMLEHAGNITTDRQVYEVAAGKSALEAENIRTTAYKLAGAAEYMWNVWRQTTGKQQELAAQQMEKFIQDWISTLYDAGAYVGMYQEYVKYMLELDRRIQAAGGARGVQTLGANDAQG